MDTSHRHKENSTKRVYIPLLYILASHVHWKLITSIVLKTIYLAVNISSCPSHAFSLAVPHMPFLETNEFPPRAIAHNIWLYHLAHNLDFLIHFIVFKHARLFWIYHNCHGPKYIFSPHLSLSVSNFSEFGIMLVQLSWSWIYIYSHIFVL